MLQSRMRDLDVLALATYQNDGPQAAVALVTNHTLIAGQVLHEQWLGFYGELFVRFRDYSTIVAKEGETRCGCEVQQPGLSEEVKKRIVLETGTHYQVRDEDVGVNSANRLGGPVQEEVYVKDIY